ncbi:unnamed protein product [Candida verbasci]|uniref:Nitrogen permease regulator 2 n=1 Tax=Candida verbasci TaxID=1227364 RepID=A0A9W4TX55_9ASCO|nr:unnamed protein product [Candida verbasci]
MDASDGFIPIVAIFYAVFHPIEGTKIVHQFPENSISTTTKSEEEDDLENEFFNFDTVKNYVIPKPKLCNRLISFKINKFKVIGYPVNMQSEYYSRNSFSFNFCFVFRYGIGDVSPYESAIKKMGEMFQVLEEQNKILSKLDKENIFCKNRNLRNEEKSKKVDLESYTTTIENYDQEVSTPNDASMNAPGHSKTKQITLSSIESLIQQIYQDLNNYSECCIPLDNSNSVDIKLFPILPPPVNIKAYQVPIATVKLNSLVDVNWDPTMIKILPYINGLNSVKKISELADANYLLTKQCIQHLMHYKCIEIIDIFQFSNIYAPTSTIGDFLKFDSKMAEECQAYVVTTDSNDYTLPSSYSNTPIANNSPKPNEFSPSSNFKKFAQSNSISPYTKQSFLSRSPKEYTNSHYLNHFANVTVPSKTKLFHLYRSLNQSLTVKEWYIQNKDDLVNIDIRRFINFGILRKIIYRVYSYPLLNSITRSLESGDEFQYDKYLKMTKHEKKKVNDSNDNLLKTKVNEQTLKTEGGRRKVSFTNSHNSDKVITKHYNSNEVIFEDESEDSDSDESGSFHIPLSERRMRNSNASSSQPRYSNDGFMFSTDDEENEDNIEEEKFINLIKLLKGFQHFDSICTELQISRTEVEKMIEKLGSFRIINS